MSRRDKNRVCPVGHAGILDNRIRRCIQNPRKILVPFVEEGMTVLDIGCGPGFFTLDMAQMVGETGRVIASDLQEGMLDRLRDKIQGTSYEDRITTHNSERDRLGSLEGVDFALAFYVVHEVPDKETFFRGIHSALRPGGQVLVVEPLFHVSKAEMSSMLDTASEAGFEGKRGPGMLFGRAVVLRKQQPEGGSRRTVPPCSRP